MNQTERYKNRIYTAMQKINGRVTEDEVKFPVVYYDPILSKDDYLFLSEIYELSGFIATLITRGDEHTAISICFTEKGPEWEAAFSAGRESGIKEAADLMDSQYIWYGGEHYTYYGEAAAKAIRDLIKH